MVCHQYVRVDRAPVGMTGATKVVEIVAIICLAEKTALAIVTTLNDVLREIDDVKSGFSRHEQLLLLTVGRNSVYRNLMSA